MTKSFLFLLLVFAEAALFSDNWEVAVDEEFPPYVFVDEDGEISGIHTEIVKAALDTLPISYNFSSYPWKRVVYLTDMGKVTCSIPWVENSDRFEKYIMVGPVQEGKTVFAVAAESTIQYEDLSDLIGYRIGTISGYAYPEEFESADYLTKIGLTVNNSNLIQLLLHGRVDIIIGDENVILYEAKKMGVSGQLMILPKHLKEVFRYVAFPKSNEREAELFEDALRKVLDDKVLYEDILSRYR